MSSISWMGPKCLTVPFFPLNFFFKIVVFSFSGSSSCGFSSGCGPDGGLGSGCRSAWLEASADSGKGAVARWSGNWLEASTSGVLATSLCGGPVGVFGCGRRSAWLEAAAEAILAAWFGGRPGGRGGRGSDDTQLETDACGNPRGDSRCVGADGDCVELETDPRGGPRSLCFAKGCGGGDLSPTGAALNLGGISTRPG